MKLTQIIADTGQIDDLGDSIWHMFLVSYSYYGLIYGPEQPQ